MRRRTRTVDVDGGAPPREHLDDDVAGGAGPARGIRARRRDPGRTQTVDEGGRGRVDLGGDRPRRATQVVRIHDDDHAPGGAIDPHGAVDDDRTLVGGEPPEVARPPVAVDVEFDADAGDAQHDVGHRRELGGGGPPTGAHERRGIDALAGPHRSRRDGDASDRLPHRLPHRLFGGDEPTARVADLELAPDPQHGGPADGHPVGEHPRPSGELHDRHAGGRRAQHDVVELDRCVGDRPLPHPPDDRPVPDGDDGAGRRPGDHLERHVHVGGGALHGGGRKRDPSIGVVRRCDPADQGR